MIVKNCFAKKRHLIDEDNDKLLLEMSKNTRLGMGKEDGNGAKILAGVVSQPHQK